MGFDNTKETAFFEERDDQLTLDQLVERLRGLLYTE